MKGTQDGFTRSYKQQQLLFILKNFTNSKEITCLIPREKGTSCISSDTARQASTERKAPKQTWVQEPIPEQSELQCAVEMIPTVWSVCGNSKNRFYSSIFHQFRDPHLMHEICWCQTMMEIQPHPNTCLSNTPHKIITPTSVRTGLTSCSVPHQHISIPLWGSSSSKNLCVPLTKHGDSAEYSQGPPISSAPSITRKAHRGPTAHGNGKTPEHKFR